MTNEQLEAIKESDPATYWKNMYEAERNKHYRCHHPDAEEKNRFHTLLTDCVYSYPDMDTMSRLGKEMSDKVSEKTKENWKNDKQSSTNI